MSDEYIRNFYEDVCKNLDGDYKIVLPPNRQRTIKEDWIEYDSVEWQIEDSMKDLINTLLKKQEMSLEEKIIKVYEFICLHYVYDANVLYFFRKDTTDPENVKYIAIDWYGRVIGEDWIEKRKAHNRRICYEFSRFYAKAINMLIDKNAELEAIILGDRANTHYVVGLTGKDYSMILDQDDFNQVKDLTRIKLGLTINGIHIFREDTGKFKKELNDYNKDKSSDLKEVANAEKQYLKDKDMINYLNTIVSTLNNYNIDPQGFFEYIKNKMENFIGIDPEKIWKEDVNAKEKRYERCLYFNLDGKMYLLDSIERKLTIVNLSQLDKNLFIFNPEEHEYKYYGG